MDTHLPRPVDDRPSIPASPPLPATTVRVPPPGGEIPVSEQEPVPSDRAGHTRPAWLRIGKWVVCALAAVGAGVVLVTGVDRGQDRRLAVAEAPAGFTTFRDDRLGVAVALPSTAATLRLSGVDAEDAAAWVDDVLPDLPDETRIPIRNGARDLVAHHGVLMSFERSTGIGVTLAAIPDAGAMPDDYDARLRHILTGQGYEVTSSGMTRVSGYPAARVTAVATPGGDPDEVGYATRIVVSDGTQVVTLTVTSVSSDEPAVDTVVGSLRLAAPEE